MRSRIACYHSLDKALASGLSPCLSRAQVRLALVGAQSTGIARLAWSRLKWESVGGESVDRESAIRQSRRTIYHWPPLRAHSSLWWSDLCAILYAYLWVLRGFRGETLRAFRPNLSLCRSRLCCCDQRLASLCRSSELSGQRWMYSDHLDVWCTKCTLTCFQIRVLYLWNTLYSM